MIGNKNPNDSHNYRDENHDEIEFYLGNNDRSTYLMTFNTRTTHIQKPVL